MVVLYRWIKSELPQGQEWLLKRNCMLTPKQLALLMSGAALLSLAVATAWAFQGVLWVMPFALIEVAGLAIAFFVYSKHAADMDRVLINSDRLTAEVLDGGKRSTLDVPCSGVRVAYTREKRALVELQFGQKSLKVGRFVPEGQRIELAQELAQALKVQIQSLKAAPAFR
jgi:uncharacterized membrane protein